MWFSERNLRSYFLTSKLCISAKHRMELSKRLFRMKGNLLQVFLVFFVLQWDCGFFLMLTAEAGNTWLQELSRSQRGSLMNCTGWELKLIRMFRKLHEFFESFSGFQNLYKTTYLTHRSHKHRSTYTYLKLWKIIRNNL